MKSTQTLSTAGSEGASESSTSAFCLSKWGRIDWYWFKLSDKVSPPIRVPWRLYSRKIYCYHLIRWSISHTSLILWFSRAQRHIFCSPPSAHVDISLSQSSFKRATNPSESYIYPQQRVMYALSKLWVQPLHFSNPLKYIGQSLPLPSPPYYWPSMHLVWPHASFVMYAIVSIILGINLSIDFQPSW